MKKHAPGPWMHDGNGLVTAHSGDDSNPLVTREVVIARCAPNEEGKRAARLIAAAPELLDALKALHRACPENRYVPAEEHAKYGHAIALARMAIEKAGGE